MHRDLGCQRAWMVRIADPPLLSCNGSLRFSQRGRTLSHRLDVTFHKKFPSPLLQRCAQRLSLDCTPLTTPPPKSTSPKKCCILQPSQNKEMQDARQIP